MPPIMRPALQARPGGRFMEGVRHGINLPTVVVPSFKLGWGSSQAKDGLPKGTRKQAYESFSDLPHAAIIVGALKIPDMIFFSGAGICGEEDFRCG